MTRAPLVMAKAREAFARGDVTVHDSTLGWRFVNPRMEALHGTHPLGETAELVAELHHVSREEQDAFALESQRRWAAAHAAGKFADELVAVELPGGRGGAARRFEVDEHPRPDDDRRRAGGVEAGVPQVGRHGHRRQLVRDQRRRGGAAAGVGGRPRSGSAARRGRASWRLPSPASSPSTWASAPSRPPRSSCRAPGCSADQLDLVELNEAFAAQAIPCVRELHLDPARVNVNGGAIAIGHPLGASGARLATGAGSRAGAARRPLRPGNACASASGKELPSILERA